MNTEKIGKSLKCPGKTWTAKVRSYNASNRSAKKKKQPYNVKHAVKLSKVPNGMPKDKWTKDTRAKLLGKRNDAETHMVELLRQCNILHHRERPIQVDGKKYFIDFHVQSFKEPRERLRVALEIDGTYHFTPEQQAKDRTKDADLLKCSRVWSILRIRWDVVLGMDSEQLRREIRTMRMGEVRKVYDPAALRTGDLCTSARCTFPACLC